MNKIIISYQSLQLHQANTVHHNRIASVVAAVVVSVAAAALVALKEDREDKVDKVDLKVDTHHHHDQAKVIRLLTVLRKIPNACLLWAQTQLSVLIRVVWT